MPQASGLFLSSRGGFEEGFELGEELLAPRLGFGHAVPGGPAGLDFDLFQDPLFGQELEGVCVEEPVQGFPALEPAGFKLTMAELIQQGEKLAVGVKAGGPPLEIV